MTSLDFETHTDRILFTISQEIDRCKAILSAAGYDMPNPRVYFTYRRSMAVAVAEGSSAIRFNWHAALALGDAIAETACHEYAHICVSAFLLRDPRMPVLGGDTTRGHGRNWKNFMSLFGVTPRRLLSTTETAACHAVQALGNTVLYTCPCGRDHHISTRRHRLIQGGKQYVCNHCRQIITKA